jgi:hypothetical protein
MPNFQNNFATNLTSGTVSGATTSPINSIPTVDAPYYLAFDATNINAHYEVVHVTSDTATNVLHAATTYDHTIDEEVRMVLPAVHLNTMQNFPEGFLINGKIVVTDAAGITVAIKGLNGNDPSVTNPVYVMIGGALRSITAALSVAKADATNWFNAGSAELATKEIDYFAYLGYNATDGVVLGFSRIPFATLYSDFSATTTNEKYCAISTITNAVAGDNYVNIGRFAATLSAGAGYTWTVPTFTASNLIQRPIYETRKLAYVPTCVGFSSIANSSASYKIVGSTVKLQEVLIVGTSNSASFTITLPFSSKFSIWNVSPRIADNGVYINTGAAVFGVNNVLTLYKDALTTGFTTSSSKILESFCCDYEI